MKVAAPWIIGWEVLLGFDFLQSLIVVGPYDVENERFSGLDKVSTEYESWHVVVHALPRPIKSPIRPPQFLASQNMAQ